jgi:iron complex outermembrane receptor protein
MATKQCGVGSLLVLALINAAFAADTEESLYFSDLPIVASASRLPQRLADAPTSMTVIDREMLRTLPIRDLNDVFRLVPGFQTFAHNTESGRVTYHGLTDEEFSPRVQVLVDGRSMYSPAFRSGVNWALIPVALEDIERIEVVRGTNAVSYGSNAFLGVINIITIDASMARGFSMFGNHGTQNVRDHGFRAGGRLGEIGDVRLTYRKQNDNGLTNRSDWIDSFTSELLDLRADLVLGDRDTVQINLGRVDAMNQRGRLDKTTWRSSASNPIRDFDQRSTFFQTTWRHTESAAREYLVRYAYTADEGSEAYLKPGAPAYVYDPLGARGVRHEIEAQQTMRLLESLRLVSGLSWRQDTVSSQTQLAGKGEVRRDVGRIFGNLEWRPQAWFTGNLGLSYETDSLGGEHASPRLGAAFHLTPENTLRFGASRAYRTGSVVDYRGEWWDGTKYQFRGNPNMASERMDTLEVGFLGDWRAWRMSLDVRVFQEKVYNRLLQIDQNDGNNLVPDEMMPVQNIRMHGLEYQWRWQPFETTRLVVNQAFIESDAAYTDLALSNPLNSIRSNTDKFTRIDELAERGSPRRATSVLLYQKLPLGLELTTAAYWQDKSKWSINTWAEKYHRVDLRLGYPFKLSGRSGEIAYVGQSMNGAHIEYKSNPGDPATRIVERRQWVSLRLDF